MGPSTPEAHLRRSLDYLVAARDARFAAEQYAGQDPSGDYEWCLELSTGTEALVRRHDAEREAHFLHVADELRARAHDHVNQAMDLLAAQGVNQANATLNATPPGLVRITLDGVEQP